MIKMKKVTFARIGALILVLAMLFVLVSCDKPGTEQPQRTTNPQQTTAPGEPTGSDSASTTGKENTEKSDETIVIMLAAEPTTLTGLTGITDQVACIVEYAIGGHLFEFNREKGDVDFSLAESYEVIDELHYRIKLRDDIHYTDGTPVTAADVVYTVSCCIDGKQDWTNNMDIENFVIEDDRTLVVAYSKYTPGWAVAFAEASAAIYSEASVQAVGGLDKTERNAPLGCGRYNAVEWKAGEYILLERNENYWDKSYNGYYKYIKLMWSSDAASRLLAVKSGDAQVADTISISEAVTLQNDPNTQAVLFNSGATFMVYFNCSKGVFTDPKLREAVSYAIDSEGINQVVNMGLGTVAQGFVPASNKYYHEYHKGGINPYDPEKAKQLMKEAGYGDGLAIECKCLRGMVPAATLVQESLRQLGITMEILPMDPGGFVPEARAGNYDLTIGNTDNSYIKPDNFNLVRPNFEVIGGPKITDPAMTEILSRATSSNPEIEAQGWYDVIEYIFDNHCLVGLYNKLVCHASSRDIEGLDLIKRDYLNITKLRPVR